MPDVPQIIVPAPLYDSTLAVLLFLALWQAMLSVRQLVRAVVRPRRER